MTQNTLDAAVALLIDIAGPEPVHIEMAAHGPKKYYEVHRALSAQDARAHLAGRSTRGATLRHPQGLTRALCYDADTPDDWLRLIAAAWLLSEQGYTPLLEASPAQAEHAGGGHLWIIYTAPVLAAQAHRHVVQSAPGLQEVKECWPGPGSHKVRLPGGRYMRPGVYAWCRLYDSRGTLLSEDGAARVLLDMQTAAQIVPAFPDAEPVGLPTSLAAMPNPLVGQDAEEPAPWPDARHEPACKPPRAPGVDQHWHEKYSRYFWFQFTPAQLAAWYNERTRVQNVLPPEKNGMGLASWRRERTASVGLRTDGWVDFGASARRKDGRQDGGDTLELAVRITQEAKPEAMRQIARQLVQEARKAMESAAWCGEEPPGWVVAIMTEAGWERYHALRAEARYGDQAQADPEAAQVPQPTRGVAGFYSPSQMAQGDTQPPGKEVRKHHKTVSAVPHTAAERRETPETLAAAMGVELSDPCPRCGCPLRYPLEPYLMCYKCHPPRGLADDYWRQLCALFPLRLSLQGR